MIVNKKKTIWLINQYAMPPHLESRLRTIKFAEYLTDKGYDVTIFASSIMHNMNINLIEDNSTYLERTYGKIKFVHIKTLKYRNNTLKRIISSLQFSYYVKKVSKYYSTPDIIVATAMVPFGNSLYYLSKKLKSKFIVEVVDLWPMQFIDFGLIRDKSILTYFLYKAERWLYRKSDALVLSMEGGKKYIKDKGWDRGKDKIDLDKVHYINNGVDITDFRYNAVNNTLDDSDLENINIKKIVYVGSIRLANNLRQLIDAAALLKNEENIKFLIYGDGDDRVTLKEYCKINNISNVIFKEKWIEPKYIPYLLSMSTVNILNYTKNFGRYGGSQSKLFQYMASGKPICSNLQMMFCPITKHNIGIAKEFKDAQEYADAILSLVNMDEEEYLKLNERAINAAKEFDYKVLTDKMVDVFNSLN